MGRVEAARFTAGEPRRVAADLLDLTLSPDPGAGLATQLLHGEAFTVYETRDDGLAWGQSDLDGYVGYVRAGGLGPDRPAGRRVTAIASHGYAAPSLKARATGELPFLADLDVTGEEAGFARTPGGFVPLQHLAPLAGDAASVATRFEGTPYLWGGRSARGLDCSALVQLALLATGRPAPRDSDMQGALLGAPLSDSSPGVRGDLVFWRGHVGMLLDAETLIHANAHHMAVAIEPVSEALARIKAAGSDVTGIRRIG
jgi:cell wall-associated NlpC family hydrolase